MLNVDNEQRAFLIFSPSYILMALGRVVERTIDEIYFRSHNCTV